MGSFWTSIKGCCSCWVWILCCWAWIKAKCCSTNDEENPAEEKVLLSKSKPTDKKWYHGKISNQEADNSLRSASGGTNGSYLVYDDPAVRGQYVLLVYLYTGDLLRWMIRPTRPDGMYILGDDGPGVVRYRTISKLIKAHRGITGKPIKMESGGAFTLSKCCTATTNDEEREPLLLSKSNENSPVVTRAKNEQSGKKWYAKKPAEREREPQSQLSKSNEKCPEVAHDVVKDNAKNELVGKKWYRGSICNKEADRYLDRVSQGHNGSYIVYDNPLTSGQYILLVYHKSERLRWKIQQSPTDDMYILGDDGPEVNRYKTVKELIKAHRGVMGKPIETEKGGIVTLRKM